MRYRWEMCPNLRVNILHLEIRLPHTFEVTADESSRLSNTNLDDRDWDFFVSLARIDGVETVASRYCQIQFMKSELFDWEPIRAQVERIVKDRYAPDSEMSEVEILDNRMIVPEPEG